MKKKRRRRVSRRRRSPRTKEFGKGTFRIVDLTELVTVAWVWADPSGPRTYWGFCDGYEDLYIPDEARPRNWLVQPVPDSQVTNCATFKAWAQGEHGTATGMTWVLDTEKPLPC